MTVGAFRSFTLLMVAVLAVSSLPGATMAESDSPPENVDWPGFGADPFASRYSPASQIDQTNFDKLEIAWAWDSLSTIVANQKDSKVKPGQFKVIPIEIDGLVFVATEIAQVAAVDATSGETVWSFDPESWKAGRPANVGFQHRGVAYWKGDKNGRPSERIFIATHDRKLHAIDARTGEPVGDFGEAGAVDLLPERGKKAFGRAINHRHLTHSSPPVVVGNTVIVGSIVHDGAIRRAAPPGHVRGFDAITGEFKWIFHTIPQEGEEGVETWENDSWRYSGNTNVWSMMAFDPELGYVYLPVSTPTNDFYGGHRLGDNLFAESLVCLDAETGEKVWHFQMVHHGLWDYDLPTSPNLVDIEVDGKSIKAVAQVSKQGFTYVFDRVTGRPVWPIEERPVPASDVPGERASATQPHPTRPAAFAPQGMTEDQLIDFTPALRKEALEIMSKYRTGPLFTPPSLGGTLQLPSAGGGANWPGAAVDPETGILYVPSSNSPGLHPLSKPDPARSNLDYVGSFFADSGGPRGLPLVKPPWGRVTAIDLNTGEHVWMSANGFGPRSHPALEGLDLPMLGNGSGAPLVTGSLLFVTQRGGMGEENKPGINVFDKKTGEYLGLIELPDVPNGNPVTYVRGGKQYIVVATGGGPFFAISEDLADVSPEWAETVDLSAIPSGPQGTRPRLVALALP